MSETRNVTTFAEPADSPITTLQHSASLSALAKALARAQAEMKNPPKDRINPHYRSKYADLATVRDWILPVLNRHGLSVIQLPCERDGRPALFTLLLHESGEYVGACVPLRPVKDDPQGMGSALTYARRYALQAIAGVAGEDDDDGNTASGNVPRRRRLNDR
ncbi:MAG: ERF family protein, partial [Gemmataceae bacterium]|nr:ERF family protein [Gemmataceae bacterium]